MSIESPLSRFFTWISLPACGHASAHRCQLVTVVCRLAPRMSPEDWPVAERQGTPTVHWMFFWLVRLNARPLPVVPLSCAFHVTLRWLPFDVTTAVACQLSIVARLIWKPCAEKSSVSWLPERLQSTVTVPVSSTRPRGPVHPAKAYVTSCFAVSCVWVRQPAGTK